MHKQIFIVRHGQTDFNKLNIVQGSGVDTDLNELGLRQADMFYQAYHHLPFDAVFTSSLKRAQQSVKKFIDKGIPHVALPELNEISWGDFEGKQQNATQKEVYWHTIEQWKLGNLELSIPNGESPMALQARQQRAKELILNHSAKNILVCMHGRAMKSFLCLLLNQPLTQMEAFQHTNLCLYQLEYNGEDCTLLKQNDVHHLEPKDLYER
jgi:broad specificity phosphatase PhoE